MKRASRGIAPIIIIVLIAIFLAIIVAEGNGIKEITYSEFMTQIAADNVEDITLSSEGNKAVVKLKNTDGFKMVNIPSLTAFMNAVEDEIKSGAVNVKEESPSFAATLMNYITPITLVVIFVLFWSFMMQSMNGGKGAMSFTKNRARLSDPDSKNKVMFKDVAGLPEEMEELEEVVEFLLELECREDKPGYW